MCQQAQSKIVMVLMIYQIIKGVQDGYKWL